MRKYVQNEDMKYIIFAIAILRVQTVQPKKRGLRCGPNSTKRGFRCGANSKKRGLGCVSGHKMGVFTAAHRPTFTFMSIVWPLAYRLDNFTNIHGITHIHLKYEMNAFRTLLQE